MVKIANEVLAVLGNCTFDGPRLMLPGQMDRAAYQAVNKVLEANGGKWNRGAKAHVFPENAEPIIEQVLATGEFQNVKQELGQFDTPEVIVDHLMQLADIKPGMTMLEPSAGLGNIAVAAIELHDAIVRTIEADPKRAAHLVMRIAKLGAPAAQWCVGSIGDFLQEAPAPIKNFDRIVMNPPFAKQADIDHVLHALRFLKPGGRLVAIMSASITFRTNRKTTDFLRFIAGRSRIERLPVDAFKESGTSVNTVVVVIEG